MAVYAGPVCEASPPSRSFHERGEDQLNRASELIFALKSGEIDSVVRGTLPAKETLDELKRAFKIVSTYRSALICIDEKYCFFLAPVGIDEGIFIDERFAQPPFPPFRIYTVADKLKPVSVRDSRGNDLLRKIEFPDGKYISNLLPGKYQGITELHDLILDLGDLYYRRNPVSER